MTRPGHPRRTLLQLLALALSTVVVIPIGVAFDGELASLPPAYRMVAAAFAMVVCAIGGLFALQLARTLGRAVWLSLAAICIITIFAAARAPKPTPDALQARLTYPDGTFTDPQAPEPANVADGSVAGFVLRPKGSQGRNPNGISAQLATEPHRISVMLDRQLDEATPASARDAGVAAFQVDLLSRDRRLLRSERVDLAADHSAASRTFALHDGIGEVHVALLDAAPASPATTPAFVARVDLFDRAASLLVLGKAMLVALGVGVVLLVAALYAPTRRPKPATATLARQLADAIPILVVGLVLLAITWWTMSQSTFVYFWDYRNYWEKTEVIYELLASGQWSAALARFVADYSADYALLPAVPPALTSLVTGYPTRTAYDLTLAVLYATPAYLSLAWLGKRLLDCGAAEAVSGAGNAWAFAALPVVATLPIFLTPHLTLMPDIGGVALSVAAVLLASNTVRDIGGEAASATGNGSPPSVDHDLRSGIALGLMLALMFLFRRWFVFQAAGIATCTVLLVTLQLAIGSGHRAEIVRRTARAAVVAVFAALPLLCWVAFDWSRNLGTHDYANLYASYKALAGDEWDAFSDNFGLAALVLVAVGCVVVMRAHADRRLAFVLLGSALVAAATFLQIQSPGRQHYYLLMPAFGGVVAALSIYLGRRSGPWAAAAPTLLLFFAGCVVTWAAPVPRWMQKSFAGYSDWLPRQQEHLAGYQAAVAWLLEPANRERHFCLVGSSPTINQSVFLELWQVFPALRKDTFRGRMVLLGDVDSRAGPPGKQVRDCEIVLVGVPFQYHLSGQQQTLQVVQDAVATGQGFGQAYSRQFQSFPMDNGIELRAYTRTRDATDAEYDGLVARFHALTGR